MKSSSASRFVASVNCSRITQHGYERWALAVARILTAREDPRTMHGWSRAAGASESSLREWCKLARCRPKDSLDLGRVLRALSAGAAVSGRDDLASVLDIRDGRTFQRLMERAGILKMGGAPTMEVVLRANRLAINRKALTCLGRLLGVRCLE